MERSHIECEQVRSVHQKRERVQINRVASLGVKVAKRKRQFDSTHWQSSLHKPSRTEYTSGAFPKMHIVNALLVGLTQRRMQESAAASTYTQNNEYAATLSVRPSTRRKACPKAWDIPLTLAQFGFSPNRNRLSFWSTLMSTNNATHCTNWKRISCKLLALTLLRCTGRSFANGWVSLFPSTAELLHQRTFVEILQRKR